MPVNKKTGKIEASNTFEGGLLPDLNALSMPANGLNDALNVEFITVEDGQYILQNIKGNKKAFTLPEYMGSKAIPLAVKVYNNIAYIVSGAFDDDGNFLAGAVGSFPSPDWSRINNGLNSPLQYKYSEFCNFDYNGNGSYTDPLVSTKFNFSPNNFMDITVVGAYDGSADVIFADDKNPTRLVNSRFKVDDSFVVTIADRSGNYDSNEYSDELFDKTELLATPDELIAVDGPIISNTGKIFGGGYRYYFKYATPEGNLSDIIYESPFIPIAKNDYGINEIQNSSKAVIFKLSGLDISYSSIKVYFEHAYGENGVIIDTYEIVNRYKIDLETKECVVTHSGYEKVNPVDVSDINVSLSTIDKVKSLAVVNNRLILANTTTTTSEEAINLFKQKALEVIVTETVKPMTFGSYADPFAVIHELGYWRGEVYEFGIVFLLNKGGTSPVFPVSGKDYMNITGNRNDMGIMRTDPRGKLMTIDANSVHTPNITYFTADTTPLTDPEIKKHAYGFFFVRRERLKNAIVQGVIGPVAKIPTSNRVVGVTKYGQSFYAENRISKIFYPTKEVPRDPDVAAMCKSDDCDMTCTEEACTDDCVSEKCSNKCVSAYITCISITPMDNCQSHLNKCIDDCDEAFQAAKDKCLKCSLCNENTLTVHEIIGIHQSMQQYFIDSVDKPQYPTFKYVPQQTQYIETVDPWGIISAYAAPNDQEIVGYTQEFSFYSGDLETDQTGIFEQMSSGAAGVLVFEEPKQPIGKITRDILKFEKASGRSMCEDAYDASMYSINHNTDYDCCGICSRCWKRRQEAIDAVKAERVRCLNAHASTGDSGTPGATLISYADEVSIGDPHASNIGTNLIDTKVFNVASGSNIKANRAFTGFVDRELSYIRAKVDNRIDREYSGVEFGSYLAFGSHFGTFNSEHEYNDYKDDMHYVPATTIYQNYSVYLGIKSSSSFRFKYNWGVSTTYTNAVNGTNNIVTAKADSYSILYCNLGYIASIYNDMGGIWSYEDIPVIFKGRGNRPYFAVSERLPLDTTSVDIFRGDGYIGKTYKRITYKAGSMQDMADAESADTFGTGIKLTTEYDDGNDDDNDVEKIRLAQSEDVGRGVYDLGVVQELISYTNTNVDLRSVERLSASDSALHGGDRDFYPHSEMNRLRSDSRPDSKGYNHGYTGHPGILPYFALDENSLVFNDEYPNRIIASPQNVTQQAFNSFKDLRGFNFRDYGIDLGPIYKIVEKSGVLISIHYGGTLGIGIDDRTLMSEGTEVYIDSAQALSPKPLIVSDTLGTQHPESIIKTDLTIMGVDYNKSAIWQYNGQNLTNISEFAVKTIINGFKFKISEIQGATPRVYGTFDTKKHTALFTFVAEKEDGNKEEVGTIVYSDILKRFTSRFTYGNKFIFNINNRIFTFGADESHSAWEEDALYDSDGKELRCIMRDMPVGHEIEIIVNDTPQVEKMLDNILLVSNKSIPVSIEYKTTGDVNDAGLDIWGERLKEKLTKQIIYTRRGGANNLSGRLSIIKQNAYYKNSGLYIEVSGKATISKKSAGKTQIRDKVIKVRFVYTGSDETMIQSIFSTLTISHG
jgi:hypothetical protein